MNKQEAEKQVRMTFTQPFNESVFRTFSKNLLKDLNEEKEQTFSGAYIKDAFKPHITSYKRLGSYIAPDGETLDVLTVKISEFDKLDRARTMQRNFVSDYLRTRGEKDSAIVAFYNEGYGDWRFSYVKMQYKIEVTEKGKIKVKEELTPARRYSFLVGENEPNHTAQQQIAPLLEKDVKLSLAEIENSFNIESVTKEFFTKYKELFLKLDEEVEDILKKDKKIAKDFITHSISTANFAKKLMGQIVFLYFIQKKGWLGVPVNGKWGEGDRRFLRTLFDSCKAGKKNFFNDYLEYLFYDALNNDKRGTADPSVYSKFNCKIPFLNGGLFEPMNGYDWESTELRIENDIFAEILDTFDLYNFTVREDEPLEKEVAVDPEMLGKVFENLLEVTDRKSKGAFYTPREIVHYMCQESLINYLDIRLNTEKRPIGESDNVQDSLLKDDSDSKIGQEELSNDEYIERIPRGDIEEFINRGDIYIDYALRNKAKRDKKESILGIYKERELPNSIIKNALKIDELLHNIKICDPAIGSGAFPVGMMNEIVRARYALSAYGEPDQNKNQYNFKRQCIQDCIYGVDIDPGAVEIAKLRLWLSLVVDEEDFSSIQPLPNLDYKIICGNSLLGVDLEDMFFQVRLLEIETLKQQYFDTTNREMKCQLHEKIESILFEITGRKKCFDFRIHFSEVFHKNKGFDVLLGNPPYGLLNKRQNKGETIVVSKEELKYYTECPIYKCALGGMLNIFRLFIIKSIDIMRDKACFSEIFPLAFIGDVSIGNLRKNILNHHQLLSIEAFPERDNPSKRVFSHAKMSVCIMNLLKSGNKRKIFFLRTHYDKFVDSTNPKTFLSSTDIEIFDNMRYTIPLVSQDDAKLLSRIYSSSIKFNKIAHCYTGELDLSLGKEYISDNPNDPVLLRGAGIDRYILKKKMSQGEFLYIHESKFLKQVSQKRLQHFKNTRIVLQGITGVNEKYRLKMTLIPPGTYCANSTNYLDITTNYSIYLILGILNSYLLNYIFSRFSTNSNVNGYEIDNLPFPKNISSSIEDKITRCAKLILASPDNIRSTYDKEIDLMVYKLYGLNEDEIRIVEKFYSISA